MFLGHYAVALGAKRIAPGVSLGTLFLAAQFVDLLWPFFLLLGVESVTIDPGNTAFTPLDFDYYPITHSMIGGATWSFIVGGVYYALRRRARNATVVGGLVFSHWFLDFLTHRPDLPIGIGSTKVGLGLWNSVPGTLVVELGLFAAGEIVYLGATRALDKKGIYGFWGLIGVLLLTYVGNVFGPPPPGVEAIAIAGNALWLFVLWGYWLDRHRTAR